MDRSGGFVVASEVGPILETKVVVNRIDASGNLDAGFGSPAFDPTPGQGSYPTDIAIQPDGRILVAGSSMIEPFPKSFMAGKLDVIRLLSGGAPDGSFGPGGVRVFGGPQGGAVGVAADLDRAGKLLVTGMSFAYPLAEPFSTDVLVARISTFDEQVSPRPPTSAWLKFAGIKRNKRKGTATLFVEVSGPGTLTLAGGRKLRSKSKRVGKAGKLGLPVGLRRKARKLLLARAEGRRLGRLKVKAGVRYLPAGASQLMLTKRFKLVKR
jgi:hypothetical protein